MSPKIRQTIGCVFLTISAFDLGYHFALHGWDRFAHFLLYQTLLTATFLLILLGHIWRKPRPPDVSNDEKVPTASDFWKTDKQNASTKTNAISGLGLPVLIFGVVAMAALLLWLMVSSQPSLPWWQPID
jgi:hypothetical protein